MFLSWDARTRLWTQRTRVRRSGMRQRGRDAADSTSVPHRATWISRLALTRLKLASTRLKSCRLTPIRHRRAPIHVEPDGLVLIRAELNWIILAEYRCVSDGKRKSVSKEKKKKNLNRKYRWTGLDIDTPLSPMD